MWTAAVSDLQDIDVAGEDFFCRQRDDKAELVLHMGDVFGCEVDRHLDGHRHGVGRNHEMLELVMTASIMGDGLQDKLGDGRCKAIFLANLDRVDIEHLAAF